MRRKKEKCTITTSHRRTQESTASEMDWIHHHHAITNTTLDEKRTKRSEGVRVRRGEEGKQASRIQNGESHTMTKGMYLTLNGLISAIRVFSFLCGVLIFRTLRLGPRRNGDIFDLSIESDDTAGMSSFDFNFYDAGLSE